MSVVSSKIIDHIAVIAINNPPVNALSHAVRSGILEELKAAENNSDVKAVILICEGRTFCAGADISEFGKPPQSPTLPKLMSEMDKTTKPLIAAIHGTALGGGFELALCCHYRIMNKNAKVGLPEVNLGLIPGAGGTQRLPRIIGAKDALDMICTGKPINAEKAQRLGIVDSLSSDDLLQDAIKYVKICLEENKAIRRTCDLTVEAAVELFDEYQNKVLKSKRGYIAPVSAIKAVEAAAKLSFDDGIKFEQEEFAKLVVSDQSKAQRHLFFAEREAAKIPGMGNIKSVNDVKKVAVIGGGIMGCGIAVNFLNKDIQVTLLEISKEASDAAFSKIENIYLNSLTKGRISEAQKNRALSYLNITCDYSDLSEADLIIEAVFEDMDVKKKVFEELDRIAKKDAILATNTSFLDINEIAAVTSRPGNVIGLHFFSPAHIMPLLEIVRTDQNDHTIIATALKLGKLIEKTTIISGVCYGFIANRMSSSYGREAGLLLLEGASVEQIDQTLYNFGMPMGMFTMLDMAGIDIGVMARKNLSSDAYDVRAYRIHAALVDAGQKGQKTGTGFYIYDGVKKTANPKVQELAVIFAKAAGIKRREISDKEIEERCIFALINEGYRIVEEGIAFRSSDVDVVYCQGFGFPRYLGGPLYYAKTVGHNYVLEKIEKFAKKYGQRWWKPSQMLVQLAKEDQKVG